MTSRKKPYSGFKLSEKRGVTAIVLHGGRVLIMKRIWLPFIRHPGIWTFPAGGVEKGETTDEAVYRELSEETGLGRESLRPIAKREGLVSVDKHTGVGFRNTAYVFESKTGRIRLNIENTAYAWAAFGDIAAHKNYANIFSDEQAILRVIRKALQK